MNHHAKPEVMIDCRMIEHSGIGVLLRQLLRYWAEEPPAFSLKLLGNRKAMARLLPSQLDAEFLPFHAPIYGVQNLFASSPYKKAHLYFSPHYSVPLFALRMKNVIMIQDLIHLTYPPKLGTSAYMKLMFQFLRRFSTLIVTPSRHTKVQLQTLHGFHAHRVLTHALGPGLNSQIPIAPEGQVSLPPVPRHYWLAVGIDKPHKNFDQLLQSYSQLLKTTDSAQHMKIPDLVFAGIKPEGRSRIARLITQLHLSERVHLLQPLPDNDVPNLYSKAEALIFPSLDEGFGFPVVEAMNHGIPVVCANLPPMNEIAAGAGIFYDPDDENGVARILEALTDHTIDREKLAENGRQQAKSFEWKFFAQQLEESFSRAINEF